MRLGEFDKAAEVCSRGLQSNPAAPELVRLLEVIFRAIDSAQALRGCHFTTHQVMRQPLKG